MNPRSIGMERLNKFENEKCERFYGQLAISAGLCVFSKLEKDVGYRYEPIVLPPPPRELTTDDDDEAGGNSQATVESLHVFHLLNWFALFLAHSSHDSTAVAMVKKDNTFLIHVSINKDTVDEADRKRASSLLRCIYQAITPQKTGAAAQKGDVDAKYDSLIRTLVDTCWPRMHHGLEELKAAITEAGGIDSLVEAWKKGVQPQEHTKAGATATNAPADCLLNQLTALSTMVVPKPSEGTIETRFQCLTKAMDACKILVNQYSVPKSDDDTWYTVHENRTYRALDQLFQHIRTVNDYHLTTTGFLAGGVDFLRKHVGKPRNEEILQEHMKIVWVRDTPNFSISSTHKWDLSPKEWIDAILKDYSGPSPGLISHPRDKEHQVKLTNHCADFWTKGSTIPARVHPGIELLYFLEEKGLKAVYDVIGTSSELCYACGIYFDRLKGQQHKQWLTRSGCANKIETNWLLPPVNSKHCIGQTDWARNTSLRTGSNIRLRAGSSIDAYLKKK